MAVRSIPNMLARAGPILMRLPAWKPAMVEVGVSVGLLAAHLLDQRRDLRWYGIDPWRGRSEQPPEYIATGDVHARLTQDDAENHMAEAIARLQRFGDRAIVRREASPAASRAFADEAIDLVFLDGDHSRAGVLADCRGWWPKLKQGAWLAGHDYDNRDPRFMFGVEDAVKQFSAEIGIPFALDGGLTWWMRKPFTEDKSP